MSMVVEVFEVFSYGFVIKALIAVILLAIISSYNSFYIFHKKMSFLTPGIAHTAFAGVVFGYLIHSSPGKYAIIFSFLMLVFLYILKSRGKLSYNVSVGIIFSFSMALAVLFISLMDQYIPEINTFLFGNVFTVNTWDILVLTILAIITVLIYWLFFKYLSLLVFDEELAKIEGLPVNFYNVIFLILVTISVVVSLKIVGTVIVFAYLLIPPVIANFITHNFKKQLLYTFLISLIGSLIGFFVAVIFDVSVSAMIVIVFMILFIIAYAVKKNKCNERLKLNIK